MIPLIKHYVWSFFFDENAAKRFFAGLGGLLGAAAVTVLAFGTDTVLGWSGHDLFRHALVASASAVAAMLPGPAIRKPE